MLFLQLPAGVAALTGRVQRILLSAWYGGRWWAPLLTPFAWLFRGLVFLRRHYLQRVYRRRPPVPIVVVGNIILGGTGKTPLLIALAQRLKAEGFTPGVISRGYGGSAASYPLAVGPQSSSAEAGDEALLIARETRCPVVVGADRRAALDRLLVDHHCDVVLSDDGLQHYQLARDIEIAVIDAERGLGNGRCLPAGPLREPPSRLRSVDWVVVNGGRLPKLGVEQIAMHLLPTYLYPLAGGEKLDVAQLRCWPPVRAVAGIGNPQRFFTSLERLGLEVEAYGFADHHRYRIGDLCFGDDKPLLMTAKDAVKCLELQPLGRHWWYLAVAAQLPDSFYRQLAGQIRHHRDHLAATDQQAHQG